MADLTVTAAQVGITSATITRPMQAGGAINVGQAVYVAADGDVEKSDANTAATSEAIGIVVAVGTGIGDTTAADGDAVTVAVFGPVTGFSSLDETKLGYVSATTGGIADTAPSGSGSWTKVLGRVESSTTFFVMPGVAAASSNS